VNQASHHAAVSVLVVDDEPEMCEFVRRVLDEAGYRAFTAANGNHALQVVADIGIPHLLLTDLKMPEMEGDELAARLRHLNPDVKILYLTGFSPELFKAKGTLWEGEAFLEKPCSVRGLLEGVSLLLFGSLIPTAPGLEQQRAAMRALLVGLPKNTIQDRMI
jgi:two-component system, cell cycle sensor histidine kinase and response regulator CckA